MSPEMIGFIIIAAMLAGISSGSYLVHADLPRIAFGYWGFGELVFY